MSITRITAAAIAVVALGLGSAAEIGDTLAHPSFEQVVEETGMPVGWTPWSSPSAAAYSLADARTGVACVAILDEGADKSYGLRSEPVRVEPGAVYRASVWTKILGGEKPGPAVYLEFWSGKTRVANYSTSTAHADEWTELAVQHEAPEDAEAATVLVYSGSASIGYALFDDVALDRVD